ncbi:hypothetical protein LCGC14_1014100 [marine sediment metagenome]|uniref:Uncharacterized protein n=1 Tax=marine sediment metagenome TaxID=412755 RepID=A0A0F9MZB8_9ZZZZ
MKILSDVELARAFNSCSDELIPSNWDLHSRDDLRNVAIEAQKDTLRQVRELLDGIENPYKPRNFDWVMQAYDEAIQTIKALLEE